MFVGIDNNICVGNTLPIIQSSTGSYRYQKGTLMQHEIFGERIPSETYTDRIAAYVVLKDNNLIAVVKTPSGKFFLPGGKIEDGETMEECILRECMEEMGMKVALQDYFAVGERYFYREQNNRYSHVTGHFYYAIEYEKVCEPLEAGSEVIWMTYEQAMQELYHPHHKWAVECAEVK